jgi:predicted TIM-barrel fold metal-dependent hydrolase
MYLPGSGDYRPHLHRRLILEPALSKHPRLSVYLTHAGWPMTDVTFALLYAHPQVYVDVDVISWVFPRAEFHRYLQRMVDAGFGNGIMLGSDQMNWSRTSETAIDRIRSAPFLTQVERRDVVSTMPLRFLRLSADEIGGPQ